MCGGAGCIFLPKVGILKDAFLQHWFIKRPVHSQNTFYMLFLCETNTDGVPLQVIPFIIFLFVSCFLPFTDV